MTYPQIDVRGRSCPEPVILTKKALEQAPEGVVVLADSTTARDNIGRFAQYSGFRVETEQVGNDYSITLSKER